MATHAHITSTHAAERAELHRIRAAFAHELGRLNRNLDSLKSPVPIAPLVATMSMPAKTIAVTDPNDWPDEYALIVQGDCMLPEIADGACLMFDKREPVRAGDLVVIYFRSELVPPGQHQGVVKRLVLDVPPHVRIPYREHPKSEVHAIVMAEQLNPRRQFRIKCQDLLAIHRCMGPVPEHRVRVPVTEDEALDLACQQRHPKQVDAA